MKRRFVWLVPVLAAGCAVVAAGRPEARPGLSRRRASATCPGCPHAKTRSISPENFTGEKGKGGMATEGTGASAARDLGQGWKVSPSVRIKAGRDVHAGRHRRARARSSTSG